MPTFDITAPDGTKFRVTGPDGSTKEDALAQVQKKYAAERDTSTAKADNVLPTKERSTLDSVIKAPGDFLGGVIRGASKASGGIASAVLDQVAPKYGDQFAKFMDEKYSDKPRQLTQEEFKKATDAGLFEDKPNEALRSTGDFVGQILPFAMMPEAKIPEAVGIPAKLANKLFASTLLKGFAGGATGLEEGDTASERNAGRLEHGVEGTAFAKGTELAGRTVIKGLNASTGVKAELAAEAADATGRQANAKNIDDVLGIFKDWTKDNDPALRGVRANLNEGFDKTHQQLSQRAVDLGRHQDLMPPVNLKDIERTFETIGAKINSLEDLSPKGIHGTLQQVLEKIAPQYLEPEVIKSSKGITWERIGPGNYQMQGTNIRLSGKAKDTLLESVRRQTPLSATYSQIKSGVELIDEALAKGKIKEGSGIANTARELQNTLQSRLDNVRTPALAKHEDAFATWREKHFEPLLNKDIKEIVDTRDPVDRANKILDLALGKENSAASTAAKIIGPQGQEAVLRGAVKKGLDSAYDAQNNLWDAKKFRDFFEGKENLKHFMDAKTEGLLKGLSNYLEVKFDPVQRAPKMEMSKFVKKYTPWALATEAGMLPYAALTGHGGAALAAAAGTAAGAGIYKLAESLMNDTFGRHLLQAAGRAKPGSGQMARAVQMIEQRFAVPMAARQAAAQGDNGGKPDVP